MAKDRGFIPQLVGHAFFDAVAKQCSVEWLAAWFNDTIQQCEGLTAGLVDGEPRVGVQRVCGVAHRVPFETVPLETTSVPRNSRVIRLVLDEQPEPLVDGDHTLEAIQPRAALVVSSSDRARGIELARLRWQGNEPRIDLTFWPDGLPTIASHPASKAALDELRTRLKSPPLSLRWLLNRAEGLPWIAIVPELLDVLGERYNVDPHSRQLLAEAAGRTSEAETVHDLLRILDDTDMYMSPVVEWKRRRFEFQAPLHAVEHRFVNAEGNTQTHHYVFEPLATTDFETDERQLWLGLLVDSVDQTEANGSPLRVLVHKQSGPVGKPIRPADDPQIITTLQSSEPFEIEIRGATVRAGLYVEQ